jgi:hypothetical protein
VRFAWGRVLPDPAGMTDATMNISNAKPLRA